MNDLAGKSVLVTGGTGSFGRAFIRRVSSLPAGELPERIIVFSRDELKQHLLQEQFRDVSQMRYRIGDVRDYQRLLEAMDGVDIVVHAAALKHVPACELNPFEAKATNVDGTVNVVRAAIARGVEKLVFLSTDKAVQPENFYGATKALAEKIVVGSNVMSGRTTRCSVVRYGNVFGSRGSVLPRFLRSAEEGKPLQITHPQMTRFILMLDDAVSLVFSALYHMLGGEIFIPLLESVELANLAYMISPNCETVGIRPGEKMHEVLATELELARSKRVVHDAAAVGMIAILPYHPWWDDKDTGYYDTLHAQCPPDLLWSYPRFMNSFTTNRISSGVLRQWIEQCKATKPW